VRFTLQSSTPRSPSIQAFETGYRMPKILIDPESTSLDHRFAIVKTKRTDRARYPEGCVTVVADADAALAGAVAGAERGLHPAIVYGPSSSSEGQRLYYLVRWLA